MKEWIFTILKKEYDINALQIYPFYHLWRVKSKEGDYILKSYKQSKQLINWLYYLSEALIKRGFTRFSFVLPNKKGSPFFYYNEDLYIVMPFIKGRHANYNKIEDIKKVVEILAAFHHYGSWIGKEVTPPQYKLIYYKLVERLNNFKAIYYKILPSSEPDLINQRILKLGQIMIDHGKSALKNLDLQLINRLQNIAIENRMVSHRDVAGHNFLIGDKTMVIDLDMTSYEPQYLDIWQLLNRIMLEWQWNLDIFYKIENIYGYYHKLTNNEKILIRQLSLFPNDFFREVNGLFYHSNKYYKKNVDKIIEQYLKNFDNYMCFREKIIGIN